MGVILNKRKDMTRAMSESDGIKESGLGTPITISVDLFGGAKGYLVIDSTFNNGSAGGIRIAEDLSLEEVCALAHEMTLKFAFIGLPRGGAKSGLRIPAGCSEDQKRSLLREFGQRLAPLIRSELYTPGTDLNCTNDDLAIFYQGVGFPSRPNTDTSFFTAISVAEALAACRESLGNPTKPLRVAIEGFGNVAKWLVKRLPTEQFLVTAISTHKGGVIKPDGFNLQELAGAKDRFGDELVDHVGGKRCTRESVLASGVDILVPAARTWSLSEKTAPEVRASFIVPIANAPYGKNAVSILESKGCVCLPGFVVNSGGVFASYASWKGVPLQRIESMAATCFRPVVSALLSARAEFGISPYSLAERIAIARFLRRGNLSRHGHHYWLTASVLLLSALTPKKIFWRNHLHTFTANLIELRHMILECGRTLSR